MIWTFIRAIPGKLWGYALAVLAVLGLFAKAFYEGKQAERQKRRWQDLERQRDTLKTTRELERKTEGKTDAVLIDDLSRKP